MSDTSPVLPVPPSGSAPRRPVRRVRHEVRDQALVMAFTLAASVLFALLLTLVAR